MPDWFVRSGDDLLKLLDDLLTGTSNGAWWDGFFADESRRPPFLVDWPDENLAAWFGDGLLTPGRVLELGCGNGRNAVYLASLGCRVDAVDFSARSIEWTRERLARTDAEAALQHCSIFDTEFTDGSYDLVYDSGCFHHVPPHRRPDYAGLVRRALKPGGSFGLVCFRPEGGSGYSDLQVYERASLGGGLGYSAAQLRALWDEPPFTLRTLRQMVKPAEQAPLFGEPFLWTLLATKTSTP